MNGSSYLRAKEERTRALAGVAHDLHQALQFVHHARYLNAIYALGLDLPAGEEIDDALAACSRAHKENK